MDRSHPGWIASLCVMALMALSLGHAAAQTKIAVDPAGIVHADGLVAPPSDMISPEAQKLLVERLTRAPVKLTGGIAEARIGMHKAMQPVLDKWLALYPSRITSVEMNGVRTDVIEPSAGIAPENTRRVLISLHGGGFFGGAGAGALAEAVPLSGEGRIKIVSVDYRLAPEHRFPAASEDVEKVYAALLKNYKPENIGIYGCSAGGTLTGQALAWFQKKGLPRPGAAGVFCAGLMPRFWFGGDALAFSYMMNGMIAATPEQIRTNPGNLYLADLDRTDPLITPGLFPDVLAKFPPTLLVTGTRDNSMSNALVTNMRLLEAGADTQLLVLEGLGHSEFNTMPGTPEGKQAFHQIWRFFDRHLGR